MKTTWTVCLLAAIGLTSGCATTGDDAGRVANPPVASLGVRSTAPTDEQAQALGLEHNVRYRGQVVEEVVAGSPADSAGIEPGDALLRLDENELYSQDDIADFLRVSDPGQEVEITFVRDGAEEPATVAVRLGSEPGERIDSPRLEWQYASLAQLPAGLEEARAKKKKVLVGLSGAET